MKLIGNIFLILTALAIIIGSGYLATLHIHGWGWGVFVGFLTLLVAGNNLSCPDKEEEE